MEIRRFGVGHRRPDGPPRSRGVYGQVIHSDRRGVVSELAFGRRAVVEPHTNPNTTWFVVIEGGGFVEVGGLRARVAAGEAVLWPAGIVHGAWTELSEMRAIVVEFAGADDAPPGGVIEGRGLLLGRGGPAVDDAGATATTATTAPAAPGEGHLAPQPGPGPDDHDRSSGEPW
ncbi:MAG: cupin domain-containing protein [Chloroflexota bacterium]